MPAQPVDKPTHLPSDALRASLRARSAEIEQARRMPPDLADAIRDEGLFRLWVPAAYDGPAFGPLEGLEAIAALAEADGAASWVTMIALTTSMMAYLLPPDHAKDIYGSRDAVTGGFAVPVGRAMALPGGGLRVTGRWPWGSGTSHCTMIGGGVVLVDADGTPSPREDGLAAPFVYFEPEQVELLDTWHVVGMAGSGSTDYTVTDAVVPEGRWAQMVGGTPVVDAPLSRFPLMGLLALGIGSVAVGLGRRAVEELVDLAGAKRPQGSRRTLAERPATQLDLARAEATVRSSWALISDVVGHAWETAQAGDPLTVEQRRLCRLAATDATNRCADAVRRLHLVAGGEDVYLRSPIQRMFRDIHVATQHAMVAERTYEVVGRVRLGLETDVTQL